MRLLSLAIFRTQNIIKLIISYLVSSIMRKPIHWGMPLGIAVEPINSCNLKCIECPTGMEILGRNKGKIDIEIYKKTVDELGVYLTNIIFYFQGEPFLNSSLFNLISYAEKHNIYTLTSTNGHFLKNKNVRLLLESGLKKLIISIDGTTQQIYEKYRVNGSLSKVLEGTKSLVQSKKEAKYSKPKVVLQFLVTAENEHQIEDAKILAKNLRVDKINFKTAQIYDFEKGSDLIPKNAKYSRYKRQKNGTYKIKSKLKNRCWRMWSQPVITATGDVIPCCFDKDADHKMGNLKEKNFREIWQSDNYQNFREKLFSNRKAIEMCKNCTEGLFKIYR